MLRELVELGHRLDREEELPPLMTKEKPITWVIRLDRRGGATREGPYPRDPRPRLRVADRWRSGSISKDNLKPYLLADDARYALGVAEEGKKRQAELAHQEFVDVVCGAAVSSEDPDIAMVATFLGKPLPQELLNGIKPKDFVTFRVPSGAYPARSEAAYSFWPTYLKEETSADKPATCSVCGQFGKVQLTLPKPVVLFDQQCQVTSFNEPAFESFGKRQTTNAPLCFTCAAMSIQTLEYLIETDGYHATAVEHRPKGKIDPLRSQKAVFWLKRREQVVVGHVVLDVNQLLALPADYVPQDDGTPPPELAQLEEFVRAPHSGKDSAVHVQENAFYLGLLSANKARLVVREWIAESLERVRDALRAYLDALRTVEPFGRIAYPLAISALTMALGSENAGHTRGLLRCAYLGLPPAEALLYAALGRATNPKVLRAFWERPTRPQDRREIDQLRRDHHAAVSVIKLVLTWGKEEATSMVGLDRDCRNPAYLCGRLLAVAEEAQQRASRGAVNATLVDRHFGGASRSPAYVLTPLVQMMETAYLPQVRRKRRGERQLREELQEVMSGFDANTGMPDALTPIEQARFAVGFYQQRAAFSQDRLHANQPAQQS